jgi:hypothetical protein
VVPSCSSRVVADAHMSNLSMPSISLSSGQMDISAPTPMHSGGGAFGLAHTPMASQGSGAFSFHNIGDGGAASGTGGGAVMSGKQSQPPPPPPPLQQPTQPSSSSSSTSSSSGYGATAAAASSLPNMGPFVEQQYFPPVLPISRPVLPLQLELREQDIYACSDSEDERIESYSKNYSLTG